LADEARWGFNWEAMTEKCIEALVRAQREAQFLQAARIGTEHVLIGLMSAENLGAEILSEMGVDVILVRATLEKFRVREAEQAMRRFSWRVRRAVEIAFEEARALADQAFINTDQLYLGLLSQEDSTATRILMDLRCPLEQVMNRLRQRQRPSGDDLPLLGTDWLEQIPVAADNVPELEQLPPPAPSLELDRFLAVLDELGRALQTAQRTVEAAAPGEIEAPLALRLPEVPTDPTWPVVDEEVYQIAGLVRQILSKAVLRRSARVSFEPSSASLRIEFHQSSGRCEVLEVPAILRSVLPFKVMRMARLNPMEKGRELEGKLVFRYRGQAHPMRVRSEPVLKGLRVEVYLSGPE
jgi:type II secretory ATPase GspE/PulE/Tfp pilus assembly ATPase PilB-like protein